MKNVERPNHYTQFSVEVKDIQSHYLQYVEDGFHSYCIGNVIKYCMRYEFKNGIEDLQKALEYLKIIDKHYRTFKYYNKYYNFNFNVVRLLNQDVYDNKFNDFQKYFIIQFLENTEIDLNAIRILIEIEIDNLKESK